MNRRRETPNQQNVPPGAAHHVSSSSSPPPAQIVRNAAAAYAAAGNGSGPLPPSSSGGPSTNPRVDRKPPVPRFGGGGNNATPNSRGGGQPQSKMLQQANQVRQVNRGGNTGGGGQQARGGAARDDRPRYQARPGEEDLVSAIEADIVNNTGVVFDDIAGQDEAKAVLEEAVVLPALMPEYYQGIRRPSCGVLLYGEPGTSKTMLARAVANQGNITFFNISHATLTSKWRGEGEKAIRILFEMASFYAPSIIFIDEIDALCSQRGVSGEHEASKRAKSQLLTQMNDLDGKKLVMLLGATNHPWDIDDAMRRRFEQRVYVGLPQYQDRIDILQLKSKEIRLADDVSFEELSSRLEGQNYSGADITTVCRDAAMQTMRRFMNDPSRKQALRQNPSEVSRELAKEPVTMDDFYKAISKVPSSVTTDQVARFQEWRKQFQANP